jgi:hypothetical protein
VALLFMALCPIATFAYLAVAQPMEAISGAETSVHPVHRVAGAMDGPQWFQSAQPYVLVIWLGGVALLASRLLSGAVGVARLRHSRLPVPPKISGVVERLGKRLHLDARSLVFSVGRSPMRWL